MAEARVIDWLVGELERTTTLGRAAARAAVRGVVERALYRPETIGAGQLQLLVERLLPSELARIGVGDARRVCERLASELAAQGLAAQDPETPDEIFGRMIRR